MKTLLHTLAATALLPLALWSAPAAAHPTVVVNGPGYYAPPAARVDYRPAMPCHDAVWVSGSWVWSSYGWQWTPGYWQQPRPVVYYQPVQRPVYAPYPVQSRPAYAQPSYQHRASQPSYQQRPSQPSYQQRPSQPAYPSQPSRDNGHSDHGNHGGHGNSGGGRPSHGR